MCTLQAKVFVFQVCAYEDIEIFFSKLRHGLGTSLSCISAICLSGTAAKLNSSMKRFLNIIEKFEVKQFVTALNSAGTTSRN